MADWMRHAACLDEDPDDFFPLSDTSMTPVARAACTRCPVIAACLNHAVEHGINDGIWGGMTAFQRRLYAVRAGGRNHPARDQEDARG